MTWADLSSEERDRLLMRKVGGEDINRIAQSVGIKATTLDRRLREWAREKRTVEPAAQPVGIKGGIVESEEANYASVYQVLKKGPVDLRRLSEIFDRSEMTIKYWLNDMQSAGYRIEQVDQDVSLNTFERPVVKPNLSPLGDDFYNVFTFGVASDMHAGSTHSQPTSLNRFIGYAYKEYGVRHIMVPGDVTTGVYGYRGQEFDLVPGTRPASRKDTLQASQDQVFLADAYLPKLEGLQYYGIGGNHDYWHIVNSGLDAVAALAAKRPDFTYLGYDLADVPLTDKIALRMFHPHGGAGTSYSAKLQKSVSELAFEELDRAIAGADEDPHVRILLSGHLHIEVKFQRGNIHASQVGCFEGQTNYMRTRGLTPSIGGQIWRLFLGNDGDIKRVDYTWIPFREIKDDWKNWPIPTHSESGAEEPQVISSPLFVAK